ncbi:hypothetical protein GCM10007047_27240 [Cerasicoccus arenae]|uniref:Uncharacterized protein n=2 Tax=Cerasicoccus arenae TaxID=424488 RepID=A0A8J3DLR3_9BACT|nr:hypothetical protein GCM10007047_27240 [Cerasicoccus arenae]
MYHGSYPGPTFGKQVHPRGSTWFEYILNVYTDRSFDAMTCPSRPDEWTGSNRGLYTDYGYNQRLSPVPSNPGDGPYRKGELLSRIANPGKTILVADSIREGGASGKFSVYDYDDLHPRHGGSTVNVLYLDQHIENIPLDKSNPPDADEPLGRDYFAPEL